MTEAEALAKLKTMLSYAEEPALTDAEVADLLAEAARAAAWTAATAYQVGDRIVTTDRNGRLYRCRVAGTSGATEPDFGAAGDHYLGRPVDDGPELVWEDAGPAFRELWDLKSAAQAGWLLKAGKCVHKYYFGSGGQMFSRQQMHAHCLKMAARYQPLVVA